MWGGYLEGEKSVVERRQGGERKEGAKDVEGSEGGGIGAGPFFFCSLLKSYLKKEETAGGEGDEEAVTI